MSERLGYQPFPADGHTARWRPWDDAGSTEEALELTWENEAWTASGIVGREKVHYVVRISPTWRVRQFLLFRDLEEPDLWLGTDGNGRWGEVNGDHRPELDGCVDIDLACTPFTKSLPIRRLPMNVGDAAEVTVAAINVDTLGVRPEHHRYTRLDSNRWRFEHLERDATVPETELIVDDFGLVRDFPNRFRRIG